MRALRRDLVGTTADFRRFDPRSPLPLNHLPGENRGTAGRIGEVELKATIVTGIALPIFTEFYSDSADYRSNSAGGACAKGPEITVRRGTAVVLAFGCAVPAVDAALSHSATRANKPPMPVAAPSPARAGRRRAGQVWRLTQLVAGAVLRFGCVVLVVGSICRSATAGASAADTKPGGVTNDPST